MSDEPGGGLVGLRVTPHTANDNPETTRQSMPAMRSPVAKATTAPANVKIPSTPAIVAMDSNFSENGQGVWSAVAPVLSIWAAKKGYVRDIPPVP